MATATHVKFGDGLEVTDEGGGVIRVDSTSADSRYIHNQSSPSDTWVIIHNLDCFPSVSVVDSGGSVVDPNIHYDSADQVTVSFGSPTSGKAYLN